MRTQQLIPLRHQNHRTAAEQQSLGIMILCGEHVGNLSVEIVGKEIENIEWCTPSSWLKRQVAFWTRQTP